MLDLSRVQKELTECNKDTAISGVTLALKGGGSDLTQLAGTITGPVGTPYEGGIFHIDIKLPSNSALLTPQKLIAFVAFR